VTDIVKQNFAGNDVTQEVLHYLESKMAIETVPYYRVKEKIRKIFFFFLLSP